MSGLSTTENVIPLARTIVASRSLQLFHIEEILSKYKIGNKKLDELFEGKKFTKNFSLNRPGSEKEKIRQLRNCLAHAEYRIKIINDSQIQIYVNNGSLEGEIELSDFVELIESYKSLFSEISEYSDYGILSYNYKKLNEQSESKAINQFVNSIRLSGKELSKERTKELKKWVKSIGVENLRLTGKDNETLNKENEQLYMAISFAINATCKGDDNLRVFSPDNLDYAALLSVLAVR